VNEADRYWIGQGGKKRRESAQGPAPADKCLTVLPLDRLDGSSASIADHEWVRATDHALVSQDT
jgi:hypothetical protein